MIMTNDNSPRKNRLCVHNRACCVIGLVSIIVVTQLGCLNAEFFSAVAQLKQLSSIEFAALKRIDNLLSEQTAQLELIKNELIVYRNESRTNHEAEVEPEERSNPISAFHRLKRLSEERKLIEILEGINPSNQTKELPGQDDFEGARDALLRLQRTYQLSVGDLAEGIITSASIQNPYQTGNEQTFKARPLNGNDCFEIAKVEFKSNNIAAAILWAEEAWKLTRKKIVESNQNSDEDILILKFEILEFLADAYQKENFLSYVNATYHELAQLLPDKTELYYLAKTYSETILTKNQTDRPLDYGYERQNLKIGGAYNAKQYEALCRGEHLLSEDYYSKLTCYYMNTTPLHPYFKLWKIKVEEAGKYPNIVQFHEVIFDHEIDILKQLSQKRLQRARVGLDGPRKVSNVRTSQSSWSRDEDHPIVWLLSRRIQGITGLSMETMEQIQVGNYGLGGHYSPHRDHVHNEKIEHQHGNRIATWMFYLSDVTLGGATVFPVAGFAVWPRKGSAAFWYNLNSSGGDDPATLHGGCPVLIGSKWVANKWIRDLGQIFHKPCSKIKNLRFVLEPGHH